MYFNYDDPRYISEVLGVSDIVAEDILLYREVVNTRSIDELRYLVSNSLRNVEDSLEYWGYIIEQTKRLESLQERRGKYSFGEVCDLVFKVASVFLG